MRTHATRHGVVLTGLGLGAAQLGNLCRVTTEDEVAETVDAAWDAGIRYLDTAPHDRLDLSERRLGAQLRRLHRNEYVVSTKVGRVLVPSPATAHQRDDQGFDVPPDRAHVWDFSRDGVLRSAEDPLERTGLDRLTPEAARAMTPIPAAVWRDLADAGLIPKEDA